MASLPLEGSVGIEPTASPCAEGVLARAPAARMGHPNRTVGGVPCD